jgi:F-type H+-transporting ATPase subunit delta
VAGENPLVAGVAGRYANALFELARDEGKLDEAEYGLGVFASLLDASPDLERLAKSPLFTAEVQSRALWAILSGYGVDAMIINFFLLLAKNRRLRVVRKVIHAFRLLLAHHRGETTVDVTSAVPLSDDHAEALKAALRENTGRDVAINVKVDPGLLGGLVVKMGSRMIDTSLRTKLNTLKIAMKEVG